MLTPVATGEGGGTEHTGWSDGSREEAWLTAPTTLATQCYYDVVRSRLFEMITPQSALEKVLCDLNFGSFAYIERPRMGLFECTHLPHVDLLQDGIDYAATTIQSNYERIPFLFTVKDLVAKASTGGNQVKPGFQMGGPFTVPSYRTGLFLDPKGRGGSTGYDMAVALPALQSGTEGDAELFKENNKVCRLCPRLMKWRGSWLVGYRGLRVLYTGAAVYSTVAIDGTSTGSITDTMLELLTLNKIL